MGRRRAAADTRHHLAKGRERPRRRMSNAMGTPVRAANGQLGLEEKSLSNGSMWTFYPLEGGIICVDFTNYKHC